MVALFAWSLSNESGGILGRLVLVQTTCWLAQHKLVLGGVLVSMCFTLEYYLIIYVRRGKDVLKQCTLRCVNILKRSQEECSIFQHSSGRANIGQISQILTRLCLC